MKPWEVQKYNKAKGRSGKGPPFVQLFHRIIDTPQFARLKGSALKLLIDVARQFNGKNNGDISVSSAYMKARWRSNATKQLALQYLLDDEWIIETRKGGMGLGPSLYALTWLKIDECNGKHSMSATKYPLDLWKKDKKTTTPESGAVSHQNPVRRAAA